MTFKCPNYKGKALSTRSVGVKVCLNCGRIVDKEELTLLRKLGVSDKTVEDVDSNFTSVEEAGAL